VKQRSFPLARCPGIHLCGSLTAYLATSPLIWLTTTILAYLVADGVARQLGNPPWTNPVLLSVLLIAPVLWLTQTDYTAYFEGAQFIHFLLGPATVALALPLWDNRDTIRTSVAPIVLVLLTGSIVAAASAIMLARAFDLPMEVLLSLAPKSTNAPVALGISETIGGIPALTAVLVIMTGIIGAVTVTPLMNFIQITDWGARGFAAGVAAHGIGTARAFQVNPVAGAYAGIAMALNALLTSLIVPLLVRWLV
jgi:predicted murein hydrolase (TIGR00659 family)